MYMLRAKTIYHNQLTCYSQNLTSPMSTRFIDYPPFSIYLKLRGTGIHHNVAHKTKQKNYKHKRATMGIGLRPLCPHLTL